MFSAIQGSEQIINSIRLYPNSEDLSKCLDTIISGFEIVIKELDQSPVAISFAFSNTVEPNLYNKADLPATAFRTGNWKIELE